MGKFDLYIKMQVTGTFEVEAENLEEAKKQLPDVFDITDEKFDVESWTTELDEETTKEINNE